MRSARASAAWGRDVYIWADDGYRWGFEEGEKFRSVWFGSAEGAEDDAVAWAPEQSCLSVWTCVDFPGHWPVGAAAVVVAHSEGEAKRLICEAVTWAKCTPESLEVERVNTSKPGALILSDGDY